MWLSSLSAIQGLPIGLPVTYSIWMPRPDPTEADSESPCKVRDLLSPLSPSIVMDLLFAKVALALEFSGETERYVVNCRDVWPHGSFLMGRG